MKKLNEKIITILIAVILMAMPMTTAFASAPVEISLGSGVTGALDIDSGMLVISGCGQIDDCPMPNAPLSSYRANISSIIIKDGITRIGNNAFFSCANLTSVTIPSSVNSIGAMAFANCSGLTSVMIPSSVTELGESTFANCSGLTSVTIPSSVTMLRDCTFAGCTSLESINLPDTLNTIGMNTFLECSSLKNLTIPDNVSYIGMNAFQDCINLKTITLLFTDNDMIQPDIFSGAGNAVATEKTAYCDSSNVPYIAALSAAGYTVKDLPVTTKGEGTVETTVPVNGKINATTISVSHPASVEYAIDPNLGYEGGAFVAPDIAITNNSIVPINVTLKSLSSAAGGSVQFTDVAPAEKDWEHLGIDDSKKYIALGVQIANSEGWKDGHKTDARYAVETGDTLFGTLSTGATGHMSMVANYGLSIDQNCTAAHNLVFMFDLA